MLYAIYKTGINRYIIDLHQLISIKDRFPGGLILTNSAQTLGRVGLVVDMSVCLSVSVFDVPFQCDFFEASYWPLGHMIRSWPLIGHQVK